MEYYIYGGLSAVILILIFIIWNLLKQTEELDDIIKQTKIDVIKKIERTLTQMRDIDNRGVFEKDDEVGSAFSDLTDIVNELYKKI